jgi:hypothetical protein
METRRTQLLARFRNRFIASGSVIDPAGYDASTKVKCKKRQVLSTHRVSRCTPSYIEMAERYQNMAAAHPESQSDAKRARAASRKAICKMLLMGDRTRTRSVGNSGVHLE